MRSLDLGGILAPVSALALALGACASSKEGGHAEGPARAPAAAEEEPAVPEEQVSSCANGDDEACLSVGAALAPESMSTKQARTAARARGMLYTARALERRDELAQADRVYWRIAETFPADDELSEAARTAGAWGQFSIAHLALLELEELVKAYDGPPMRAITAEEGLRKDALRLLHEAGNKFAEARAYEVAPVTVAAWIREGDATILEMQFYFGLPSERLAEIEARAVERYERALELAAREEVSSERVERVERLLAEYRAEGLPGRIDDEELSSWSPLLEAASWGCVIKFSPEPGPEVVEVEVNRFGRVTRASGDDPRARCVSEGSRRWLLPPPSGGSARAELSIDVEAAADAACDPRCPRVLMRAVIPPRKNDSDVAIMRTLREPRGGITGGVAGGVMGGRPKTPPRKAKNPLDTFIELRRARNRKRRVPSFEWVLTAESSGDEPIRLAFAAQERGDALAIVNASWPPAKTKALTRQCRWLRARGRKTLGAVERAGSDRRFDLRRCPVLELEERSLQTLLALDIYEAIRARDRALERGERVTMPRVEVTGRSPRGERYHARCGESEAWLDEHYKDTKAYVWASSPCRIRVAQRRAPMLRILELEQDLLFGVDAASDRLVRVKTDAHAGVLKRWKRVPKAELEGASAPESDPDETRRAEFAFDLKRNPAR